MSASFCLQGKQQESPVETNGTLRTKSKTNYFLFLFYSAFLY